MVKKRILSLILIIFLIFSIIAPIAIGIETKQAVDDIIGGSPAGNGEIINKANSISGTIISVFQVVGVGVAIIMLIVLAIKYMSAAPGDKADVKKHAVPYVVGAVCLFAATGILEILEKFAENINNIE